MTELLKISVPERKSLSSPSSPRLSPRISRNKHRAIKIKKRSNSPSPPCSPRMFMQALRERFKHSHSPSSSSHKPTILVSPRADHDHALPNGQKAIHVPHNRSRSHLSLDREFRSNQSVSSLESGYTSDVSQSNLLGERYKSTGSLGEGIDGKWCEEQKNHECPQATNCTTTDSVSPKSLKELQSQYSPEFKRNDRHPKFLHHIHRSNAPETIPLSPIGSNAQSPGLDDYSPTESAISFVMNPSYNRRGSLSRPPLPTRSRCLSITGTKYYRVTPRKYLKISRATSALHLSELQSDYEESLSGNLRKLRISFNRSGRRPSSDDEYLLESSLDHGIHSTPKASGECDGPRHSQRDGSLPTCYPWSPSMTSDNATSNSAITQELAMQKWFREMVQKLVEEKVSKVVANMQRNNEELKTQVTEKVTQLHDRVKELDLRVRKTNSEPPLRPPLRLVAGSTDSINISLSLLRDHPTERSLSMSVLPSEKQEMTAMNSYPPFHSQQNMNVKQPGELPCIQVHRKVMHDLSNELPWWKFLARALEVPDVDIERIYLDNLNNTREQCYQMLMFWIKMNGHDATYRHLGQVIQSEAESVYAKYVDIVSSFLS